MKMTLHELAQFDFDKIEMIVLRAAAEVAYNAVRARDNADSRKWGKAYRAELLVEYDILNGFYLQFCDGWLRSHAIDCADLLDRVPVDPAELTVCDSCQ